ncbi:hypothetical protein K502DRAFT_345743 [Neoconidiobolus thromboides FSU 785]|nr:hypothetical protein K502DRAFT_345743 [Neoconidiobolus thromboides FSU 785]
MKVDTQQLECNRSLININFEGYKSKQINSFAVEQLLLPKINRDIKEGLLNLNDKEKLWYLTQYYQIDVIGNKINYNGEEILIYLSLNWTINLVKIKQEEILVKEVITLNDFNQVGIPKLKVLQFNEENGTGLLLFNLNQIVNILKLDLNNVDATIVSLIQFNLSDMDSKLTNNMLFLYATQFNNNSVKLLIKSSNYNVNDDINNEEDRSEGKNKKDKKCLLLEYNFTLNQNENTILNFNLNKIFQGKDNPIHCYYEVKEEELIILSNNEFQLIYNQEGIKAIEETESQQNKNIENSTKYYWTQTNEDITITILLTNEQIQYLKQSDEIKIKKNQFYLPILNYNNISWYDNIIEEESYWTIQDQQFLNIYLEKSNYNTRWPHLFNIDDNILEILDPNELFEIKQNLLKYTNNNKNDIKYRNNLNYSFMNEIEKEDFEGNEVNIFNYNKQGQLNKIYLSNGKYLLGFNIKKNYEERKNILLKNDVDALVFEWNNNNNNNNQLQLQHQNTFNAIGYIQSSKQDKKIVLYSNDKKWLFIIEFNTYCYIYYNVNFDNQILPQFIIKLPDTSDIIGINLIQDQYLVLVTMESIFKIDLIKLL